MLDRAERGRVVDLHDVDVGPVARAFRTAEQVIVDAAARVEHRVVHAVLDAASGSEVESDGDDGLAADGIGDAQAREAPEARAVGRKPGDLLLAVGPLAAGW